MNDLYTYQGGRKLRLTCDTTHFVSRVPSLLSLDGRYGSPEKISSHSWKLRTNGNVEEEIRAARERGPAFPFYLISETGKPLNATDRIFVRFRAGADPIQFAAAHRLTVVRTLSDRDYLMRVPPSADVVDVVRELTEDQRNAIEKVDHDRIVPFRRQSIDDPLALRQWYLYSKSDDPLVHVRALVDCEGAWELAGTGSQEVVVGVIDSGFDLTDPEFPDGKFAGWAILEDGSLTSSAEIWVGTAFMEAEEAEDRYHGTLASTLVAASSNRYGGLGVAPTCRLLPVKCEQMPGYGIPQSALIDVIDYLRDKADVVSNSWSVGPDAQWPAPVCDALADAAANGGPKGNGMVWVWAAGNMNCPIHLTAEIDVPAKVTPHGDKMVVDEWRRSFVNSFAGIPGVLHVGAISSFGQRCHYSNYGPGLDLVAPSNNRHLYGRQLVNGKLMFAPLRTDGLHEFGGTSATAPLVAGVAALVRSANPRLSALEIVSILKQTADKELDMNGYSPCHRPEDPHPRWDVSPIPPYHVGNFSHTFDDGTWSPWFGFGKVNARRAVMAARARL